MVETFDLNGTPQPLYQPGSSWNDGTTHRLRLCDCQSCHRVFAELNGGSQQLTGAEAVGTVTGG